MSEIYQRVPANWSIFKKGKSQLLDQFQKSVGPQGDFKIGFH